jgi:hypothetical protein
MKNQKSQPKRDLMDLQVFSFNNKKDIIANN